MHLALRNPISRRAVIKGMGATIALPFLEAMFPRALHGQTPTAAAAAVDATPLTGSVDDGPLVSAPGLNRMLLLYIPNGVHIPAWYPGTEGADYTMSRTLAPLEAYRNDLSILNNLACLPATLDTVGDHAKAMGCFLTNVRIRKTATDDIQAGISMDQVMAKAVGNRTRFPSLELGLDYGRMEGGCDPGYACIYSNNVSWRDETTPAIKEVNPRIVFDRLFGSAKASDHSRESRDQQETYNRSILDFVRENLKRLNRQLGVDDRDRMDEYLTLIREIERRLDAPPSDLKALPPGIERPVRVPETFKDHFRLMADLQILAIRQDVTRISTFTLGVEQSRRTYSEIGIPEEHHGLTHHAGNAEKIEKVCKIDHYIVQQFAYFLEKMKSVKEGDATLLDNSMVVFGNGNGNGVRHDHRNLPIILAGKGGGTLSPGRHIMYPKETPVANLWLSLMDRMGVNPERHGDSTGRLPGLAG
ncbi:MAG: DUF1552 domain-containing protein [Opitutaceae bacterium]